MTLIILLLAAGRSARMRGGDKLLEPVDGDPCLRVMVMRALATDMPVFVSLPDLAHARAGVLAGQKVNLVPVPDAIKGMAHSIRAGVIALPRNASGVMIVPADMPDLQTRDFQLMSEHHLQNPKAILQAQTKTGKPGHPVIFPADLFPYLTRLCGDGGAQNVVRAHADRLRHVTISDDSAITDLDTQKDWADWRAGR